MVSDKFYGVDGDLGLSEHVIIHTFFFSFIKGPEMFFEEALALPDGSN